MVSLPWRRGDELTGKLSKMSIEPDLILARSAAAGDREAKRRVAALAHDVARRCAVKYCKRFCGPNRRQYYCTVDASYGLQQHDAPRCEWGSFSYFFFFDALAGPAALLRYEGRNGTSLAEYLRAVAGSVSLWERWKNQRFQRRVHVLRAIEDLGPEAKQVYFWLRDGDNVPNIAQRLNLGEPIVARLVTAIKRTLVNERRTYLLGDQSSMSLSDLSHDQLDSAEEGPTWEPPSIDPPPEDAEILARIDKVLPQLNWLEQFIIQAMVMEGLSADAVLQALREQDVAIKPGQPIEQATINQVYYLRDKTVAKLKRMINA